MEPYTQSLATQLSGAVPRNFRIKFDARRRRLFAKIIHTPQIAANAGIKT